MRTFQTARAVQIGNEEIAESDLELPLAELARDDRRRVHLQDMESYADLFFAMEWTVLTFSENVPELEDRDVIEAYKMLLERFDGPRGGGMAAALASGIERCVKAMLVFRRRRGLPDFTVGEVLSCLSRLKNVAKRHRSPNGRGYLLWVKAFFEGRMPTTKKEALEWIARYET